MGDRYGVSTRGFFLVCALAVVPLCTVFSGDTPEKPIIAVLDFRFSGLEKSEVDVFIDYLSSHVVRSGMYRVIDRMQRETILHEIEYSISDATDERYQLEIGKLISANKIVVGSIGRVGDRCLLTIKLIDVATGETEKTGAEKYASFNELVDDSGRLANEFVGVGTATEKQAKTANQAGSTVKGGTKSAEIPAAAVAQTPNSKRRGHAFEGAIGYLNLSSDIYIDTFDFFTLSLGYMYQFGNFFSLGAQISMFTGEYDTFYPVSLKVSLGNKVDGVALALGVGTGTAFLGVYYRNFLANLYFFVPSALYYDSFYGAGLDIGYSRYFGK